MNMAITYNAVESKVISETKFISIICGHHVYKTVWNTVIGEVYYVKLDNLKEALEYDKYVMVSRARTDRNIESFISFSSRRQK